MTLSRTNLVLALLLACTVVLTLMSGVDLSLPNVEILPDMKYSPAYGAYSSNPNFPDGRTLQPPVPGTIARGQQLLHYEATPADALRAGEELENPLLKLEDPQRQAATRRGGDTFRIFCTACHGTSGKGDGLVPKYGYPPPPSLLTGKSLSMKDGQLVHILTYGQGSMPNFAAQLTLGRRWEVIQFIRSLQEQAKARGETAAPPAVSAGPESENRAADKGQTRPEDQNGAEDKPPQASETNPETTSDQVPEPETETEETASEETGPDTIVDPPETPTTKQPQKSEVEADQASDSSAAVETKPGTPPAPQSQSDQP